MTMTASDYVGIGTLITATAAAIVSVIVALRQTGIATHVSETHHEVQTSNGKTLAQIVEGNDLAGVAPHPPPETPTP